MGESWQCEFLRRPGGFNDFSTIWSSSKQDCALDAIAAMPVLSDWSYASRKIICLQGVVEAHPLFARTNADPSMQ